MSYLHPAASATCELVVKKSRFLAWAGPVTDRAGAQAALAECQARYPDARHHCWAYLVGEPGAASSAAMNDDGEPSGTAGKPILQVIQHKAIGDVMVVVSRYFGGVKLGAGGLVRAYAGVTEQVLSELPLTQRVPESEAVIQLDFAAEQPLRHWLSRYSGQLVDIDYGQRVEARVRVPDQQVPELQAFCAERQLTCKLLSSYSG